MYLHGALHFVILLRCITVYLIIGYYKLSHLHNPKNYTLNKYAMCAKKLLLSQTFTYMVILGELFVTAH